MIAKLYRLKDTEVKKVLKHKKPFFSHTFIANVKKNTLPMSRFALLLSAKHAPGSVNRNYWRRLYYDRASSYRELPGYDVVLVPKKGKIFDKNNQTHTIEALRDMDYLFKQIFSSPY